MNRQESYRARYRQRNPPWRDSVTIYRQVIEQLATVDTRLLDVGCGHGDVLHQAYRQSCMAVGIEPDVHALQMNHVLRDCVCGIGEQLPFADESFDLITSAWVLEHVRDPLKLLHECWRVLRPNGKIVFLTPNTWNYNVWLIRAVPNRWHSFFTTRLYNRQANDTYPVQYRLNSVRTIERLAQQAGFQRTQLILNGDPSYISFNEPLFRLACGIERLLDLPMLQTARVHLIGVYGKSKIKNQKSELSTLYPIAYKL